MTVIKTHILRPIFPVCTVFVRLFVQFLFEKLGIDRVVLNISGPLATLIWGTSKKKKTFSNKGHIRAMS